MVSVHTSILACTAYAADLLRQCYEDKFNIRSNQEVLATYAITYAYCMHPCMYRLSAKLSVQQVILDNRD
jgi:hypothetical protein